MDQAQAADSGNWRNIMAHLTRKPMDVAMDLMLDWFDSSAQQTQAPSSVETARAIIRNARKAGVNPHDLNRVSQNFLTEVLSPPEDKIRHALSFLD